MTAVLGEAKQRFLESILRAAQERVLRDYAHLLAGTRQDAAQRTQLMTVVQRVVIELGGPLGRTERTALAEQVLSEIVGWGPLDELLRDPEVTDILVNGSECVYVERGGQLHRTGVRFRDEQHLLDTIGRIVAPLGRRIDQLSPYVDARLPDGSRVNAVIPPLAVGGPVLTIRKFRRRRFTLQDFVANGSISAAMCQFLAFCARARCNLLIAGGTGSGKTTLLNALLLALPPEAERVITIEDAAELSLPGMHAVSLEARPAGIEGQGEVTIRHLVRNALRMRPDRIVVGEVRGPEAFDMLQAMHTGHDGSLSTIHANSPADALHRMENMVHMAGTELPHQAVAEQVRSAVDLVVHQARCADGQRRVIAIAWVDRSRPEGLRPAYTWSPARGFQAEEGAVACPPQAAEKFQRYGVSLPVEGEEEAVCL